MSKSTESRPAPQTSMYIYLRRADLVAAQACAQGMALYDTIARMRGKRHKIRIPWGPLAVALLDDGGQNFGTWLVANGIAPSTATAGDRGTATAGDRGTATAGDRGTATAGDRGTATAGDRGTATAGEYGTATAGECGTATAGYGGTATAGYGGTATAGYGGTATAGYGGTATAGYRGTATAGECGTATAGDRGTATAGDRGTATAGECGSITIRYWDPKRGVYRWAHAEVGENGIEPNAAYVLDEQHHFKRKAPKAE